MDKKCMILLLLFLGLLRMTAQESFKYDKIWLFGYEFPKTKFVFTDDSVSINESDHPMNMDAGSNMICDKNGELLFQTNLCFILDNENKEIPGSDQLEFGYGYNDYCIESDRGSPFFQLNIFLPDLENDSIYYFIYNKKYLQSNPLDIYNNTLYLNILALNESGNWELDNINIPIIENDTLYGACLAACKQSNLKDWWIIVAQYYTNRFFIIELTDGEIKEIKIQDIGPLHVKEGNGGGQASFSPDGTKFAHYATGSGMMIFDFNNETGELSNPISFKHENEFGLFSGLSFSSDSQFLYACSRKKVFQYDLYNSEIESSEEVIAEWDSSYYDNGFPIYFERMQLGPDCRIYITSSNSVPYMHVIMNPNEKGVACDFRFKGINMMSQYYDNLPTFPHFRQGEEEICNPDIVLTVSTADYSFRPFEEPAIRIVPNPTSGMFTISFREDVTELNYTIHRISGELSSQGIVSNGSILDFSGKLEAGMYILTLYDEQGYYVSEKLVVF